LVALGYWQRPEATAERFKPLPIGLGGKVQGAAAPEVAVFSGDTVRRDAEGFLYFVGRRDEMIKTSGYRVSPTEVEEVAMAHAGVREAVAVPVADEALGSVIRLVVHGECDADGNGAQTAALLSHFRQQVPAYMVPREVVWVASPLPRNPNGKFDRQRWRDDARL
jgi:acyl-coenzyme A synthetase/AMP-(fatty) acid ligase